MNAKVTLSRALGMYDRKCFQCKKHFECSANYAYKRKKKKDRDSFMYFCSYKCLREYDKTQVPRGRYKI